MKFTFLICILLISTSISGKEDATVTEELLENSQIEKLHTFAQHVRLVLNPETKNSSSEELLIWADSVTYDWQKGNPPQAEGIESNEFEHAIAITWAEQIVKRHNWLWVKLTLHDNEDWETLAIVSADRSLMILPSASVRESINGETEVLIAASNNAIGSSVIPKFAPKSYTNIMHGIKRILPR